ncbi:UNVERIFIED_CONTAM: hypothetical protein Slati_1639900 [Sesamum latifolium]|uniref:Uncharacterized protein n=1 Tax=Sesamum latifolium TaxID=2727402 RepID=A0AAW2X9N9_9LAMI
METETRSEPDLSLVTEAFLWATIKGPSELAMVDAAKKRAARIQMAGANLEFAITA